MTDANDTLPVSTLNIKRRNIPIKKAEIVRLGHKIISKYTLYGNIKRYDRFNIEGWKKIYNANNNCNISGVTIPI